MSDYIDVEYAVTISVLEDEPAPTTDEVKMAIFRGCNVDTEDAVHVTAEGGAL